MAGRPSKTIYELARVRRAADFINQEIRRKEQVEGDTVNTMIEFFTKYKGMTHKTKEECSQWLYNMRNGKYMKPNYNYIYALCYVLDKPDDRFILKNTDQSLPQYISKTRGFIAKIREDFGNLIDTDDDDINRILQELINVKTSILLDKSNKDGRLDTFLSNRKTKKTLSDIKKAKRNPNNTSKTERAFNRILLEKLYPDYKDFFAEYDKIPNVGDVLENSFTYKELARYLHFTPFTYEGYDKPLEYEGYKWYQKVRADYKFPYFFVSFYENYYSIDDLAIDIAEILKDDISVMNKIISSVDISEIQADKDKDEDKISFYKIWIEYLTGLTNIQIIRLLQEVFLRETSQSCQLAFYILSDWFVHNELIKGYYSGK